MGTAMVTAVAALIGTLAMAAAAYYGHRLSGRAQSAQAQAQREDSAVTGFNLLAAFLVAERDKAQAETALAETQLADALADVERLRAEVRRLGGTP